MRNKIGYVSQKAILFSGTVASNVAYGKNRQEDAQEYLKKVIEVAHPFCERNRTKISSFNLSVFI